MTPPALNQSQISCLGKLPGKVETWNFPLSLPNLPAHPVIHLPAAGFPGELGHDHGNAMLVARIDGSMWSVASSQALEPASA